MTDIITDSERDLLRFPGDAPGLLRRGSPVIHIDGSPSVVVETDGGDMKLPSGWAYTRLLALDLTDATGRAHLAWWMDIRIRGVSLALAALCQQPDWWDEEQHCHPALASLDPNDPRLLLDGSRLVDALALSLVGRHLLVGGGR